MLRSAESMSNRELVFLVNKAFVLGFSLGTIGLICFFLFAFQKEEHSLALGAAAIIPLALALLINMLYRRVQLARRLGP